MMHRLRITETYSDKDLLDRSTDVDNPTHCAEKDVNYELKGMETVYYDM